MSWEKNVRTVEPYTPGEQPKRSNMIKLNTNECPYPPAPGVKKLAEQFDIDKLRLYPDPEAAVLVKCLADYYGLKKEQVFVGVGSDDVLSMSFLTFFNSKIPILFPDITYSFYDVWADLYRIPYQVQPLDGNLCIRKEDYFKENGGVIIPNPNAPTGLFMDVSAIEDIVKANPDVIVIIDEAYVDFGGTSCLPLISKYDNLLVVQTFSKSRAMAGMRIGFAMGSEKLIHYLNDAKFSFNSYTMNQTTLVFGVEAVRDNTYFKETIAKVIKTREWAGEALMELGFSFPKSSSNFLFATHMSAKAKDIFEYLKTKDIFVRFFDKPRVNNYLRISIGTDEEMKALIKALKEYLA